LYVKAPMCLINKKYFLIYKSFLFHTSLSQAQVSYCKSRH